MNLPTYNMTGIDNEGNNFGSKSKWLSMHLKKIDIILLFHILNNYGNDTFYILIKLIN